MKVRDFIKFLTEFDMDTEIDISETDISWGGPNSSEGDTKKDAEFIYINNLIDNKENKL